MQDDPALMVCLSLFFIVLGNTNCRNVHYLAFGLGKAHVIARLRNHPLCCLCPGSCMELIRVLSTFLCVYHSLFCILLLLLLLLFIPYPIDHFQKIVVSTQFKLPLSLPHWKGAGGRGTTYLEFNSLLILNHYSRAAGKKYSSVQPSVLSWQNYTLHLMP